MAKDDAGAKVVDGGLEDDEDVGGGLARSSATNHRAADHLGAAVDEGRPEFLVRQVAEQGVEEAEGFGAAAYRVAVGGVGEAFASAELHGRHDGDGLGLADAAEGHQLVDRQAAEAAEVVIHRAEDALRELYGGLSAAARADQYSDQLGIAQRRGAFEPHLFAWPVFFGQLLDAQPVVHR